MRMRSLHLGVVLFAVTNEIEAARLVRHTEVNPQLQTQIVWPAAFPVARAYVDQLERAKALPSARIAAVNKTLDAAEKASGSARKQALALLASQLAGEAARSGDAAKVRSLQEMVRELAR